MWSSVLYPLYTSLKAADKCKVLLPKTRIHPLRQLASFIPVCQIKSIFEQEGHLLGIHLCATADRH